MPLTRFQRDVLRLLAGFRSPESYLAGGAVVNQEPDTPRFSEDFDIFHDAEEAVFRSAELDAAVLGQNGFAVTWDLRRPAFHRAVAAKDGQTVRLDWAVDSAFRFFPVEPDEELGFRLHRADVALNKALALAGRREARDFIDVLYLHANYLSLGAICWAACAKDPGFTPEFLLQEMGRNAHFRAEEVSALALARPFDLREAKQQWLGAIEQARSLFALLPPEDVGCLYLKGETVVTPRDAKHALGLTHHRGTVRGSWPEIHGVEG